jgi:aspartyl-tRNA(Asn)/glutamyl-tRNA(Gln) amidotransferase subunit C
MSELNLEDISHLAELARLELSEDEKKQFATQLPPIVAFVEQLQALKIDNDIVEDSDIELESLRADEISENREKLTIEQLKELAPNWDEASNQLIVPAVFGEAEDA